MIEIVLSVSQAIIILALLIFFYKRDSEDKVYRQKLEEKLTSLPEDLQTKIMDTVKEINLHVLETSSQNFASYLKHIKELEKLTLPRPITSADVEAVWNRGTKMAENEISQNQEDGSIELNEDNFKNIPMTKDTNVMFEFQGGESDIPTTIVD